MKSGGFNVIIGNPPYVEIPKQYPHESFARNLEPFLNIGAETKTSIPLF